ncbi:hypothetical protein KAT92_05380 [Candidatus Babeliales bacterium]|nr:hypothetical protein [Candidatus Babeliales bacterium]
MKKLYDLWCDKCETTIEKMLTDEDKDHLIKTKYIVCDDCHTGLTVVVGGSGIFNLKGTGFYRGGKQRHGNGGSD